MLLGGALLAYLGVQDAGVHHVNAAAGDEGAEQGQGHECSRANGKALANGSSGVAGSIWSHKKDRRHTTHFAAAFHATSDCNAITDVQGLLSHCSHN